MSAQLRDRRYLETPFHPRVAAACETNGWYSWKRYTAVQCFTTVQQEYFAIRNACSVFDVTPITKYRIEGSDGLAYLNRLVTRDLSGLKPGRVSYVAWCNDYGQVLDDGTVFSLGGNRWRLCSQERHLDWLLWSAVGFDVQVREETDEIAGLSLQGPTSCRVLKAMGLNGVDRLKPFDLAEFPFEGTALTVSRTGFTGDLGYELWIVPDRALQLWDRLMEAGLAYGIRPIGSQALDIARIEAGFIQAGVDFVPAEHVVRPGRARSPFELGLGWLVHLEKPNFNGRGALIAEKKRGSRHRLVRLDVEGNKPARDSFVYDSRRRVVGTVTSATWSPSAKANIALATLKAPHGAPGDRLWAEIYYNRELQWSRVMAACRVVEGAFFDPPRRRATPPLDY
jgi:aminomethyltransferase